MEPKETNQPEAESQEQEKNQDQDAESPGVSAQANRTTDEHRAPNDPAEGPRD
ncbi:hypothetical protein LX87_04176 [Larkinella arboricola]|uniref:Uncharacterized protein n=1 Tax=Larkinella arboricola TaxID=643671 RepID=A0A327WQU7_LARAB|nr:hypothetical protein [Larkinella arboricola]RAJ94290.1 hypothetical protein LX87_04176 [Larkinella arboricola]